MNDRSLCRFRIANAKRLREDATSPEGLLWCHLERILLHGTHFRRQASIGRYVADLASRNAGLIIELDGEQHVFLRHDAQRTAFMESQGYRVIRFWNHELRSNLEGVLDTIYAALYGTLHAALARFERPSLHELPCDLDNEPPPCPSDEG